METKDGSGSSERQNSLCHHQIKRCRDLDIGGSGIQHRHIPPKPFIEGGIVRDLPAAPTGLRMAFPQLVNRKPLGVCAAQSSERSGVAVITPLELTRLIVSVTGVAAITASPAITA